MIELFEVSSKYTFHLNVGPLVILDEQGKKKVGAKENMSDRLDCKGFAIVLDCATVITGGIHFESFKLNRKKKKKILFLFF